ncbi:helix-turn-helix domain-containing protein [soil metagenome]
MSGIGDALRSERRRQGRTLTDAAAETRVRESYLSAIEEEDFDVLGGDVYARGFIRLYGKYLGLDAEALVRTFREHHERPAEITAIPGATIDELMPPYGGMPKLAVSPPVYAAVGVVLLMVVLFFLLRGGPDEQVELDPNAPGPSPAAAGESPTALDGAAAAPTPAQTAAAAPTTGADPTGALGEGEVLQEVVIVVTAVQPLQLTVQRGQPPVTGATLAVGDSRTLTDPDGQQVVFTVSDFGAAEITVNGDPLLSEQLAGRSVEITCTVGERACDARPQ